MSNSSFKYPLATSTWDSDEISAMQSVIESGNFTMGKHVSKYEKSFAEYIGSKYAVMSNSGSSANLLMVAALFYLKDNPLPARRRSYCACSLMSTTYSPLLQYGLKLKFVDIDINTLNYDIEALCSSLSTKTSCHVRQFIGKS